MARVQWNGAEAVFVHELGLTVEPGDVVEVPDDRFEGYVPDTHCADCYVDEKHPGSHPAGQHRSEGHPWSEVEAPAGYKSHAPKKTAKKASS
jgi:hypothetical protein